MLLYTVLHTGLVPSRPSEEVHHRPLHGRSWCPNCSSEEPRNVHFSLSLCSYLQPYSCALGREGILVEPSALVHISFCRLLLVTSAQWMLARSMMLQNWWRIIQDPSLISSLTRELPMGSWITNWSLQTSLQLVVMQGTLFRSGCSHTTITPTISSLPSWGTTWTITPGPWGSDPSSNLWIVFFSMHFYHDWIVSSAMCFKMKIKTKQDLVFSATL